MPQARRGPASRPRRNGCRRDRMAHPATGQPDDPRRHRRTGFSIVRATSWRVRPSRSGRALLCSSDFSLIVAGSAGGHIGMACPRKIFRLPVGHGHTHSSSSQQEPLMLYAILCYHDEDTVGSWTKEQDAAVMKKLAVVQGGLTKQGRLGPVARLLPPTTATRRRKAAPPLVSDGPSSRTNERLHA